MVLIPLLGSGSGCESPAPDVTIKGLWLCVYRQNKNGRSCLPQCGRPNEVRLRNPPKIRHAQHDHCSCPRLTVNRQSAFSRCSHRTSNLYPFSNVPVHVVKTEPVWSLSCCSASSRKPLHPTKKC